MDLRMNWGDSCKLIDLFERAFRKAKTKVEKILEKIQKQKSTKITIPREGLEQMLGQKILLHLFI